MWRDLFQANGGVPIPGVCADIGPARNRWPLFNYTIDTATAGTAGVVRSVDPFGWVELSGAFSGWQVADAESPNNLIPISPGDLVPAPPSGNMLIVAPTGSTGAVRVIGWNPEVGAMRAASRSTVTARIVTASGAPAGNPSSQIVTIDTSAAAGAHAAQAFSRNANNMGTLITNRSGANNVHVGPDAASAATAAGARVPSGQSLKWFGALQWSTDGAVAVVEFLEDIA